VSFDLSALGRPGDERSYEVGDEALGAYAAATDDVPGGPVFAIVPVWETIAPASRSVASDEARKRVVHYEQDMLLHRPIVAGVRLRSRATPVALLGRPNGTSLVIHTETRTEDGTLVNEQYVTEFFRGLEVDQSVGERAPDHRLDASGDPLGEVSVTIAADQTDRYAAASGDRFEIHLDDDFARSVGLPGRVVHGLCTMALAGRSALRALEVDNPSRVRRLAVRFSAPLFPGETLTTHVWRTDGGAAFESVNSSGTPVLKDGLVELR
jgi:acyl dehydratase